MAFDKKHIIQTLCFDTQADTEELANAFADQIKTIDYELLLNNVLKKYDHFPGTIRLENVVLEMGFIGLQELNSIGEVISRQLEDLLDQELAGILKTSSFNAQNSESYFTNRQLTGVTIPSNQTLDESTDSNEFISGKTNSIEADIEVLIYYLKTGSLLWNRIDSPDMQDLLERILKTDAAKLKRTLVPELNSGIVITRIVTIFNSSTVLALLQNLFDEDILRVMEEFSALIKQHIPVSQKKNFEKELNAVYLSFINNSAWQNQNSIIQFHKALEPLLMKFSASLLKTIHEYIQKMIQGISEASQIAFYTTVSEKIIQLIKTKENSVEITINDNLNLELETTFIKSLEKDTILDDEVTGKSKEQFEANKEQLYYFTENAGLVLLNWALIQSALQQLGWVKQRMIKDTKSRNKILIWMDYLVWGKRRINEYNLILNKVLIGMHPSEVADIHESITSKEKKAADVLLNTVIEHWSILKSTSIEGLRSSFLQRKGRISNEDGGWQLHVEAKGYDILINSLPWTYSIIKSPWMEKPLFTQWSTKN